MHVQMVSGMSPSALWGGMLVTDVAIFCVPGCLILLALAWANPAFGWVHMPLLVTFMLTYALSSISLVCLMFTLVEAGYKLACVMQQTSMHASHNTVLALTGNFRITYLTLMCCMHADVRRAPALCGRDEGPSSHVDLPLSVWCVGLFRVHHI